MVRIARERIADLFALAEREAERPDVRLAHRYVQLARKVGTRYNVRLPSEYRELYCRSCSTYWIEGRTVRTRLRTGQRVRTCLTCGRARRVSLARGRLPSAPPTGFETGAPREQGVLAGSVGEEEDDMTDDDGSEEA
jgi:ribonuclease P protein subunit RPR2